MIGWNPIKLAYDVFVQKYGLFSLENSDCPTGVHQLLFSQLCIFHHCMVDGFQSDSVTLNTSGQQQLSKRKAQKFTINEDGLLGKVLIGNANKPIWVPGNSALTILGRLGKNTRVPSCTPCLIDTAAMNNLLQGISVNCCLAHAKGNVVLVIVINQNNCNVWIWQPFLAAEVYWVEPLSWDYGVELHCEGKNIEVAFHSLQPADITATVKVLHNEPDPMPSKEANEEPHPKFGPHPDTTVADFDFQKEVEHLPFKLNLGDILLDKEHQAKFIDLI